MTEEKTGAKAQPRKTAAKRAQKKAAPDKVRVVCTKKFRDLQADSAMRIAGDEFEVDAERAAYLAGRGLVKEA